VGRDKQGSDVELAQPGDKLSQSAWLICVEIGCSNPSNGKAPFLEIKLAFRLLMR